MKYPALPHLAAVLLAFVSLLGGRLALPAEPAGPLLWQYRQEKLVRAVAFSPDGRLLAAGTHDNTVKLLGAAEGSPVRSLTGHTDTVRAVAFSPDGKRVASGAADKTVRLWDAETGQPIRTLAGHTDKVRSVAFSPDGALLASGSDDRTVRIWNPATGALLHTLPGGAGVVWSVAFSPDGRWLATANEDRAVRLWDPATGMLARTLAGHTDEVWSMAFSTDGATLASAALDGFVKLWDVRPNGGSAPLRSFRVGAPILSVAFAPDGGSVAAGSYRVDGTRLSGGLVVMFSVKSGRAEAQFTNPAGPVTSVRFSPEGRRLAAGSGYEAAGDNRPGEVHVWNTSEVFADLERHDSAPNLALQVGHRSRVSGLALLSEGRTLATGSPDGAVKLWDLATGELIRTLSQPLAVHALAAAPDGTAIAAGKHDGTIDLWDPATGDLTATLRSHAGPLASLAYAADGLRLASAAEDGTVKLWNTRTGAVLRSINAHGPGRTVVALGPEGLATGGADGSVKLWNAQTGELVRTLAGHPGGVSALVFSPDGKLLATGGADRVVRIWSPATGAQVRALGGHSTGVTSLAFSSDGSRLASGSGDLLRPGDNGEVRLWNAGDGSLLRTLPARSPIAGALLFLRGDAQLAAGVGGLATGAVRVWDAGSGTELRTLGGESPGGGPVAISPDGKLIASGGGDLQGGLVRLWDAQTGSWVRTLSGHAGELTGVAFAPDGSWIASSSWDATLRIWDPARPAESRILKGHTGLVTCLAVSRDGKLLASGSHELNGPGEVRIWDSATGTGVATIKSPAGSINQVAFAPDGQSVAAACDDGNLRLWNARTGALLKTVNVGPSPVMSLAYSPDGSLLASGVSQVAGGTGEVRLWDVATGMLRRTLTGSLTPYGVAFSPDGATIASSGVTFEGGSDAFNLRLWDVQTGKEREPMPAQESLITAIAFSADGTRVVTGGPDGAVRVWSPQQGRQLATLVSLPPAEPAAGAKPLLLGAKAAPLPEEYLALTPEGYYAASAAGDRFLRFRLGQTLFPAESFQARYFRPDLVRAALAGTSLPALGAFKGPMPPLVGFGELQPAASGDAVRVNLQATDDTAVDRITLLVNGARVEAKPLLLGSKPLVVGSKPLLLGAKPVPPQHTSERSFAVNVPLPPGAGEARIQVLAYDEDGLQSPRAETLFRRAVQNTPGRLLGLAVGVSRYADEKLNLQFADKDATALADALRTQRGLYENSEVSTLVNDAATVPRVLAGLDALLERAARKDTVVLFLSGHGWRSSDGEFFFATHEVDVGRIPATALPWKDVAERLARLSAKSGRVLVLLDACHSGSAATNEELVKSLLRANTGVMIFASSKGSEYSLESPEVGHGVFTAALLEALRGQAAEAGEKRVTVLGFLYYVARRVKSLSNDLQHPHLPFLQDFDTDAPLVAAG